MTTLEDLPTRIQSIINPYWNDTLRWTPLWDSESTDPYMYMAEVDHDWRIWVAIPTGKTVVRNKGESRGKQFPTLAAGLKSLDYKAVTS